MVSKMSHTKLYVKHFNTMRHVEHAIVHKRLNAVRHFDDAIVHKHFNAMWHLDQALVHKHFSFELSRFHDTIDNVFITIEVGVW